MPRVRLDIHRNEERELIERALATLLMAVSTIVTVLVMIGTPMRVAPVTS